MDKARRRANFRFNQALKIARRENARAATLAALDDFGLVEYDAARLLVWIESGRIPNVTTTLSKRKESQ